MRFEGLNKPLRILGNGARLAAAAGLKFGVFDQETLRPLNTKLPNYHPTGISTPYDAMISVSGCRDMVEIHDIELDGGLDQMQIGGGWGDTGRQLPGSGLILTDNQSTELIVNIHSHHHPLDGVIINGSETRSGRGRFDRLRARYNGRQGVSLVGGKSYDFADCEFSHTGRSAVFSEPGAGVDIEAESKRNRDINFVRCDFIDNSGVGLLADQGDSEGVTCADCQLVGTTSWSAWPNKPRMRFTRCTFVGALVLPFASANAALATMFQNCKFTDDPALAPRGKVYFNDPSGSGPIVDLGANGGVNVLFRGCFFDLSHQGRLPWSLAAIYADNVMSQKAPETGYPRGHYVGRNVIRGKVNLYGSKIEGELTINGKRVERLSE